PNNKCIKQYTECKRHAHHFDHRVRSHHEASKYGNHDQSRSSDYAATVPQSSKYSFSRVAGMGIFFTHAADQEHLIVHRQAEQNTHYNNRQEVQHRSCCCKTEQLMVIAVLNHPCHKSESGTK